MKSITASPVRSKYSTRRLYQPAARLRLVERVRRLPSVHSSMIGAPFSQTRTPSSTWAWKRYCPWSNQTMRVQRALKLSAGMPGAGLPKPQLKRTAGSTRTRAGAPCTLGLVKYSPHHPSTGTGVAVGSGGGGAGVHVGQGVQVGSG